MNRRYVLWYYRLPGAFYANGPVEFKSPIDEREFRKYLRELFDIERLWRGTEVWPTTPAECSWYKMG